MHEYCYQGYEKFIIYYDKRITYESMHELRYNRYSRFKVVLIDSIHKIKQRSRIFTSSLLCMKITVLYMVL